MRRKNRDKTGLQKPLFFCSKNLQKVKGLKRPEIGNFEDVLNFVEDKGKLTILILGNFLHI